MANLAVVLKDEIRRLARKELKSHLSDTKQAVTRYRREIAQLKRQLQEQARKINRLEQSTPRGSAAPTESNDTATQLRFSPKSVKKQRDRLGFSAENYARLIGVSGLTIYNWEQGKSRPQRAQLQALAAVRGIGKREALQKLAELQA
ncbi:MAG TPA: helix-turn-helix domain-containing protein [Pirellulaceae bacterium]|nr:helix-turn-helix domain-containing protein [Pirellulaceae bacterium]